ncbi:uncharacterized protein LOC116264469 [Nymphaea colorata]|nr:uncharacterized protein LOC116264469 [Nymphaea colorata]
MEDRSWIQKERMSIEYVKGVETFIKFAITNSMVIDGKIRCPCEKCNNCLFQLIRDAIDHIISFGFLQNYTHWHYHGELVMPSQSGQVGPSHALKTRRLGRKQKFKVEVNKHGQPIGEKAQKFSSFIGKLARNPQVTPLTYHTWKELPQTYKDDVWNRVKEKFEGPGVKVTWVMKEHAKLWRCWRCNLRKLYKKHKALESCMKHCKVTIPEDQWRCLIQHFETTKSKEQSEKNKANRAMLKFPHNTGTKSFARLRAEKVAEGTPEPSRAEVFIMTRTSKKGNCQNQATGEAIAQINEAMSQLPEGIRDDPAPTDILSRVIGPDKYGQVHTYGMGVKPSEFFDEAPSRSELMVQNAVLREQLDDLHNKVDQVEANQAEKIRQLEASSKKVNELQVQINLLMDMIKNEEASGN